MVKIEVSTILFFILIGNIYLNSMQEPNDQQIQDYNDFPDHIKEILRIARDNKEYQIYRFVYHSALNIQERRTILLERESELLDHEIKVVELKNLLDLKRQELNRYKENKASRAIIRNARAEVTKIEKELVQAKLQQCMLQKSAIEV